MKRYLVFLFFSLSLVLSGQSINLISSGDIPGIQAVRSDTFSAQNPGRYLGERLNLCVEYGFQRLFVVEYMYNTDKVRMEAFIMEDGPSAFGLYSVSNTGCVFWKLFSTFSCAGQNNLIASIGPFCINIINLSKTAGAKQLSEQMMQIMINKNPQESWYLPPLFQHPKVVPYFNSLKYMEGPAGISHGAPQLTELLENLQFKCYSVRITARNFTGIIARIEYPDFNSMSSFVIQAGLNTSDATTPIMAMNGMYRSWYKISDTKLIYLECSSSELKLTDIIPEKPTPMY